MMVAASFFVRRSLALLPLLVLSCASNGSGSLPPNTCLSNAGCGSDAVCDGALHVCVAAGATAEVVFYATPPPQTSEDVAAPTQIDPHTVVASSTFDIAMRPADMITGTIVAMPWHAAGTTVAPTTGAVLSASMEFRRQGAGSVVPPITARATTTADGATRTYSWSQTLPEGIYDVRIVPDAVPGATGGADVPPYTLTGALNLPASNHVSEIVYPTPQVFHGVLQGDDGMPITAVRVRAVDQTDGSVHSTTAVADAHGAFDIVLSPELMPATSSNSPLVQSSSGVDWALEVTPLSPASAVPGHLAYHVSRSAIPGGGYSTDVSTLVLGPRDPLVLDATGLCTGCQTVSGTVEGNVMRGGQETVTSGTVDFVSSALDGVTLRATDAATATFVAHATIDATGSYTAQLLPGRYDVIITPNVPAVFAVTHIGPESFIVGSHAEHVQLGRVLTVNPLVALRGSIQTTVANADLSGYQVTAIPSAVVADSTTLSAADLLARATSPVLTLTDGSYLLSLDPGPYRIVVKPPPTTAFAPFITGHDVVVALNYAVGDTSSPLAQYVDPITFSAPVQVSGHVLDVNAAPVAGASILSFVRLRSAMVVGRPITTLDVPLGTATSGSDGMYTMLLSGQ